MLKIRMHKADNGDCVSIETESEFILVDGGTAQSFDSWKEQIVGQVDKIDSLIVTHIDNDHVNGVIKLLMHPECPSIEQVYFNGAEQLSTSPMLRQFKTRGFQLPPVFSRRNIA
ncbi:MBL fold metallo-hydrolase [Photobacterium sp. Hal280]|uniref:MBL fold metallo-hydrolase n=1 Tax=Photobacterium sp. Hal280 TaxID=3035163 RepID=UPI003FA6E346